MKLKKLLPKYPLLIIFTMFFSILTSGYSTSVTQYEKKYLPIAKIDENYLVTIPNIPVHEYYYIDISHLVFSSEAEAIKVLEFYLTANIIRPIICYEENYIILQILLEHMIEVSDYNKLQFYLNHLTKPIK